MSLTFNVTFTHCRSHLCCWFTFGGRSLVWTQCSSVHTGKQYLVYLNFTIITRFCSSTQSTPVFGFIHHDFFLNCFSLGRMFQSSRSNELLQFQSMQMKRHKEVMERNVSTVPAVEADDSSVDDQQLLNTLADGAEGQLKQTDNDAKGSLCCFFPFIVFSTLDCMPFWFLSSTKLLWFSP